MRMTGSGLKRVAAFVAIAVVAVAVGVAPRAAGMGWLGLADDFFYDAYYRTRLVASQKNGDVVIVSADEGSLKALAGARVGLAVAAAGVGADRRVRGQGRRAGDRVRPRDARAEHLPKERRRRRRVRGSDQIP